MTETADRRHRSDVLEKAPAGQLAHKARVGANIDSKQPNEAGNLPDEPRGPAER